MASPALAGALAGAAMLMAASAMRAGRARLAMLAGPGWPLRPAEAPPAGHVWPRAAESIGRRCRAVLRRPPNPRRDRRVGGALLVGGPLVVLHPLLGAAAIGAWWVVPVLSRHRRERERRHEVIDALPDVIDLFAVAAGAGFTVGPSVSMVRSRVDGAFAAALTEVERRRALGVRLADALEALGELGEPARPLTIALVSSERDGSSSGTALRRAAHEARTLRRRSAQEAARRLPVLLLFPLVMCILPAFGLLTVVPILVGILRSLEL